MHIFSETLCMHLNDWIMWNFEKVQKNPYKYMGSEKPIQADFTGNAFWNTDASSIDLYR